MMAKLTRRRLIASALIGGICLPETARAASVFTAHTGVKTAIQSRQTGVFNIADLGQIQTLLLVVDGVPTELHAVRNGIYQPKVAARSQSLRVISPLDFNRLISAGGGVNSAASGTGFHTLYDALKPGALIGRAGGDAVVSERLAFSADPFFATWIFACDPQRATYAVTAGALRALWTLEGQP